jgi:ubiquinone biosynthesis protein
LASDQPSLQQDSDAPQPDGRRWPQRRRKIAAGIARWRAAGASSERAQAAIDDSMALGPLQKLVPTADAIERPPMMRQQQIRPSYWRAALSLLRWAIAALSFIVGDLFARGRSMEQRARRLRATIERLGPFPIKIAQQMSVRADLLPYEFCQELGKMLDQVAPMPRATALRVIEETIGAPLDRVFLVFDETPVGSASLACVYQARRRDGRHVAVKVRRPGIAGQLAAELVAFGWILQFVEAIGLLRRGATRSAYMELKRTLLEELDFFREARNIELFRMQADATGQRYVDAPRVHFDLLGADVLVMDFVRGYFLSDILSAVDRKDTEALARLRSAGIEPSEVGRRLLRISHWQMLEGLLFHSDPHPANIVVQPGNRIVFIDFGSCGQFSKRARRLWQDIYACLEDEDIQGMVRGSIALLEPLPHANLDQFTLDMEQLYWDWLYASKSGHAQWWEKASGVLWMKFAAIARRHGVPISVEMLRVFRAIFLYDTAMVRLCQDLNFLREYHHYQKQAGRRARRRLEKAVAKRVRHGLLPQDYLKIESVWRSGIRLLGRAERVLEQEQRRFVYLMSKVAFAGSLILQFASLALLTFTLVIGGAWAYDVLTGQQLKVADIVERIAAWPGASVAAAIALMMVLRRLRLRIEQPDTR